MITDLHPQTIYAVHLRAASTSGGKDWVGSVTSNGEIHSYWGRTGNISHTAGKPGDKMALLKLIHQKQTGKDKYYVVDEYDTKDGWNSQKKQSPPPPKPKPTVEVTVDWVEAPTDSITWDF